MPPKSNQPSNLELQVLSVLWESGASTVRDVLAALPDGKARAYTTVLTVMQNMEKKGLLTRSRQGSAHVYAPAESQRQTLKPMMQTLLRNVFGGRVSTVMQHLLEETDVTDAELTEIRRLIDQRKKSKSAK
jgi:BlaI family transcriptional regulator, penicillinase repressor